MKELRIKDICIKGSSNLKQKDVEGKNGRYPVYGASGIISHIDTYHQETNYIAIVKDGSGIGRVSFMPAKSSVIGTLQYILPKDGFDINYVGYCLKSLDLSNYKQGAAIPHIYFRDYGERVVRVSDDLAEQQSIVEYLDTSFAKIDTMKANVEKALNEAKALFQSSLKELLTPKEGWEEKKLGSVYDVRDGTHDSPKPVKSGFPLVTSKNLKNGSINFDKVYYISSADYYKINERSKVDLGDVLLAMIGTIGNAVLVKEEPFYAIKNVALFKVPCTQSGQFLQYLLSSDSVLKRFQSDANGSTQKFVGLGYLRNFKVSLPSLTEQQVIVDTLNKEKSKVDQLQANYDKISQECDALKQSILKQVFE